MAISLREVTTANLQACEGLEIDEYQADTECVESASEILAMFYRRKGSICRAVYTSGVPDVPIGLIVWSPQVAGNTEATIDRVLIDQSYQGNGYGRAALKSVIRRIFSQPECQSIRIDYRPWNEAADHLYGKLGFFRIDENFHGGGELITAYRNREPMKQLRLRQRSFQNVVDAHEALQEAEATISRLHERTGENG